MPLYALGEEEPQIHPDAWVAPDAVVIGRVTLAAEVSVWPGAVLRGDFGGITVGERTSVQDGTVVHTTANWPTEIGADCVVGHNVHLEGCTIEDHCLVGSGSVVLNRVHVGEGTVVGAQALVAEDTQIPPRSMALGVPARIRPMTDDRAADWVETAVADYVSNARHYRDNLRRLDPEPTSGGTP